MGAQDTFGSDWSLNRERDGVTPAIPTIPVGFSMISAAGRKTKPLERGPRGSLAIDCSKLSLGFSKLPRGARDNSAEVRSVHATGSVL